MNNPFEKELSTLISATHNAFHNVRHPGPNGIFTPGCCADHDVWITELGKASWENFLDQLRQGCWDFVEFGSLFPAAYHYFSPAVIIYCAEKMNSESDPFCSRLATKDWERVFIPLKDQLHKFRSEYLSLFTSDQRSIVSNLLRVYGNLGKFEFDMECEWAIKEVWKELKEH